MDLDGVSRRIGELLGKFERGGGSGRNIVILETGKLSRKTLSPEDKLSSYLTSFSTSKSNIKNISNKLG